MARYTALFDACVLYPAQLRHLLIQLARTDTFTAKWTDDIQDEWISALLRNQPHLPADRFAVTRQKMEEAVPDALITGYHSLMAELELPDAKDRHVLAAAIVGRCDVIVTFNLKHFPENVLNKYDIEAQSPDEFIANLYDLHPGIVEFSARAIQERLVSPPITKPEYLSKLVDKGLAVTSGLLRASWEKNPDAASEGDSASIDAENIVSLNTHRHKP